MSSKNRLESQPLSTVSAQSLFEPTQVLQTEEKPIEELVLELQNFVSELKQLAITKMNPEQKQMAENFAHVVTLIVTAKITLLAPHRGETLRFVSRVRPLFQTLEGILTTLSEESFADETFILKLQRVRTAIEKVKVRNKTLIYPQ